MSVADCTASEEWISTGFAITLPTSNACYGGPPVVSLCACASLTLPDAWCLSWVSGGIEERQAKAAAFGLTPAEAEQLCAEMDIAFGSTYGWPDVIIDRTAALDLWSRYVRTPGARLIEHGLERSEASRFLELARPPDPEPGYSPMGESGMFVVAQRQRSMSGKDRCLGYEPMQWTGFGLPGCSWICHGWPAEIAERLGVRQNQDGLLATRGEAAAVQVVLAAADESPKSKDWFLWRIHLVAQR
jgi:hypothetical protein